MACRDNWTALITKDTDVLQNSIAERLVDELNRDQAGMQVKFFLSNYGFDQKMDEVVLTQHEQQVLLIQEAAAQHRKLLATVSDAKARRIYEEEAPPLSAKALMPFQQRRHPGMV